MSFPNTAPCWDCCSISDTGLPRFQGYRQTLSDLTYLDTSLCKMMIGGGGVREGSIFTVVICFVSSVVTLGRDLGQDSGWLILAHLQCGIVADKRYATIHAPKITRAVIMMRLV